MSPNAPVRLSWDVASMILISASPGFLLERGIGYMVYSILYMVYMVCGM